MEENANEEFEEGSEEEFRLALQMKEGCCDQSGKETDPAQAAEIIHKIGLIYRKRSPNKIALIKSAGLFNAAIARKPSNVNQIKSDLVEICQHALQLAKALNQNANLIEQAHQVKTSLNELRQEVNSMLEKQVPKIPVNTVRKDFQILISKKISAIQNINNTIADKYTQIMANVSQFCENVMGKPPCEYAIAGMGSLARKEITPYSDFEHIILLFDDDNYKIHLEYFKWYSVIFHIIILNIQETIIPSLNVSSLNDKNSKLKDWYYDARTPRGISFDGMMPHACKFPLGRQKHTRTKQFSTELIKPVSEMLEYLTSKADIKNGYHLADILTKTCYVFGNKNVFNQFEKESQKYRNSKTRPEIIKDVQGQVKDDLNNFSTRHLLTELKSQNTINIKQLVYRSTTLFITALARIQNISANSCFGIINAMETKNTVTQNTANKLRCAIAIACEMRLKVYMEKQSQCDNVINLRKDGIEKFLDIVGALSTANYFQIAYCLQCEVAKQLKFTKLHFYSNPQLINITIGLAFGMQDLTDITKYSKKQLWDASRFDFDECIEQLQIRWNFNISDPLKNSQTPTLSAQQIKSIADNLYAADIFDEALEFYKQLLDAYQSNSENPNRDYDIGWTNNIIGRCLNELNQNSSALNYLNHALEIRENITTNAEKDGDIAATLNGLGWCHINNLNYDNALSCLNRTLAIYENITVNADKDRMISRTLHNIGSCYVDLHDYGFALEFLNRAYEIELNVTPNVDEDRGIGITRINIGRCYNGLQQYDTSWNYFNLALKIFRNTTSDEGIDRRMSDTFNYMGECLIGKQKFEEAIEYLQRAQNIYETITKNAKKDSRLARTLHNIGLCLVKIGDFEEAAKYLIRSLEIYKKLSSNKHNDK